MGTIDVVDFEPNGRSGAWRATATAREEVDLSFALAAVALGMPAARDWNFQLAAIEVLLVAQLVEWAPGRPLVLKPKFSASSRRMKSLASEAIGLAAAVRLAETRHGWSPRYGWLPKDCDAWKLPRPSKAGVRPDLLFPTPGGDVLAEARGRSQARKTKEPEAGEIKRMRQLKPLAKNQHAKVFMAWAWAGNCPTRLDHFVLGRRRPLIDAGALAQGLSSQAATLWQSAILAGAGLIELPGLEFPIRGVWLQPFDMGIDVLVGVLSPELVAVDIEELRASHDLSAGRSQERVFEQPRRPSSADTTASIIDGLTVSITRQNHEVVERPAVIGPIVTALRLRPGS